ncbi:hypothetical protein [Mycobacterium paraintracellulare]|uniref:hypothetical protein n=1 Tax=Mycobacterium paraintracellulare TaxID=1138383 RepID=UPI001F370833|nr:hypothetical protein [Mycobacterium paraintracellulare]
MFLALSSGMMGDMTATASTPAHPRSRPMESWRARKAVLASRGEVDGARVAECDAALSFWRRRTFLIRDTGLTAERADALLDLIDQHADAPAADSAAAEPSESSEAAETDTAAVSS